jgi:hypothetical protein
VSLDSESHDVASLRGPQAQRIGGRFWIVAGVIVLVIAAAAIVVSFVAAANGNARIDRLKTQGVPVVVTITSCTGHIGGSGSNAAGYTCYGKYRVRGEHYQEVIGSKTTSSPTGVTVRGVADPSHPSTIALASAVAASSPSDTVYVIPIVLAILLMILTGLVITRTRVRQKKARSVHAA